MRRWVVLMPPKPRVVVTIHGIRTRGVWQKQVTPYLARYGLIPYHIDYGFFGALAFALPVTRNAKVRRIRREMRELIDKADVQRVSVIAHSFGTYIAMQVLDMEAGGLRYDRVILTGSIVPRDYNWRDAIDKKWVRAVRNECAKSDWVVSMAAFASRRFRWITRLNAGDSGRRGFTCALPTVIENIIAGDHSEAHNVIQYDRWARFISYPVLAADVLDKVQRELQAFRQDAAKVVGAEAGCVRVNLFAPIGGALRIVPGATDNMDYSPEFGIEILPKHGATGTAFDSGEVCIVVQKNDSWSGNSLPGDELKKVHPRLKWVISLPLISETRSSVIGVVNVDGLDNIPARLHNTAGVDCQAVGLALHTGVVGRFSACLEAAFRGERPEQVEA
jgi:pimeloyl-ACP methyl ester carboxylesterase